MPKGSDSVRSICCMGVLPCYLRGMDSEASSSSSSSGSSSDMETTDWVTPPCQVPPSPAPSHANGRDRQSGPDSPLEHMLVDHAITAPRTAEVDVRQSRLSCGSDYHPASSSSSSTAASEEEDGSVDPSHSSDSEGSSHTPSPVAEKRKLAACPPRRLAARNVRYYLSEEEGESSDSEPRAGGRWKAADARQLSDSEFECALSEQSSSPSGSLSEESEDEFLPRRAHRSARKVSLTV